MRPDIVISSLAHNHNGFARFASEIGATFGLQVGNVRFSAADMAEDRWDLAAFGLVSGIMPAPPPKPENRPAVWSVEGPREPRNRLIDCGEVRRSGLQHVPVRIFR